MASPQHRPWLSPAIVAGGAIALCAPLALSRYFPGLDLPFHALAVAAGDVELPTMTASDGGWSYLTLYGVGRGLHAVGFGAAAALQIVIALYVVAFALAASRLARAFGSHPAIGLLAAPAAYSVVVSYGFLPYAIALPMALLLWALVREERPVASGACALLIAITHPLAAAHAALGAAVLLAAQWDRARWQRLAIVGGAVAVAMTPALIAVLALGSDDASLPPLLRDASLWERWTAAPRPPLAESLGEAPARLVWAAPAAARAWLVALLLACAAAMIAIGGRHARRGFGAEAVLAVLAVAYFASPYTLEAPFVIAIQPRLLPLVWVVALIALRVGPSPPRVHAVLVPAVLGAVAAAAVVAASLAPFGREADDLHAAIDASQAGAYTLMLVEQPPAPEDAPASPWRSAGAYLMAEKGGHTSHAFFARGGWLPIRRAPDVAVPRAPLPGDPRGFSWERHAAGWDQFLIRDADVGARYDYFAGHGEAVELVIESGRWRLYQRRR
jgi:hypothetical protein